MNFFAERDNKNPSIKDLHKEWTLWSSKIGAENKSRIDQ